MELNDSLLQPGYDGKDSSSDQKKPNILFILTDDQRWDGLSFYSKSTPRTPNLDEFIKSGVRLENLYVVSPLCSPSRSAFLTGLYPHQTGNYVNKPIGRLTTKTVGQYMKDAGYYTGFIGKTHLQGNPKQWGFEEVPAFFPAGNIGLSQQIIIQGKKKKFEGDITQTLVDAGIQFLKENKDKNWFLWLATTAPHWPWNTDPKYQYTPESITPPAGWPKNHPFKPQKWWPGYYANITMLDEQLGRLFKALDELKLTENTFVFFASDNGLMNGSHGTRGKAIWFDEATRVPGIMRWPGKIKPTTASTDLCSSVDLIPTMLEVAGEPADPHLPGSSCLGSVLNRKPKPQVVFSEGVLKNDTIYWQMIRTDGWKYVETITSEGPGANYLYDMKTDPDEEKNLFGNEAYVSQIQALKTELKNWIDKTQPFEPFPLRQKKKKVEVQKDIESNSDENDEEEEED